MKATAVEEDGEFIVLEGSEALIGTEYSQNSYGQLKEKLIKDGVLRPYSAVLFRFSKPWSFSSPSAAAAVVLGRNSNGRLEWKVKGASQTYHDWQQAQAAKHGSAE